MTVSVIMGVYNCKSVELLKKSVQSIIDQTYDDWEFIICDDGSTDDTRELLRKIEKLDKRIRVLSYDKNQGLSFALNTCLKEAKGKYIARQDDDDVSMKNRLEKQVDFLDKNKEYNIVGCLADICNDLVVWGKYKVKERPGREDFFWNSPFIHPAVMIRKETYDVVGGYRVSRETRRCEDLDLFMRMYASGSKGYNIQEILYSYRLINNPKKKYRPMKYRIDEAIVKYKGYKNMGVLTKGIPYVIKPIVIGMIPQKIFYKIKQSQYKNIM